MKYAMCPKCGRRLCKGGNGTKVEMECPKCGEFASVIIEEDDIHISKKPIFTTTQDKQLKQHAYNEAKTYRKEREGMLRPNQWEDLIVRVYI